VSLVCGEDRPLLAAIERLTNRRIEQRTIAGFEPGSSYPAPAPRRELPRHQRQERGRQPAGPHRHRKGGNHSPQNRQEHSHASRASAQPLQHARQGDEQPSPQRAATPRFAALFGAFSRKGRS
jgi:hypothetical protein